MDRIEISDLLQASLEGADDFSSLKQRIEELIAVLNLTSNGDEFRIVFPPGVDKIDKFTAKEILIKVCEAVLTAMLEVGIAELLHHIS